MGDSFDTSNLSRRLESLSIMQRLLKCGVVFKDAKNKIDNANIGVQIDFASSTGRMSLFPQKGRSVLCTDDGILPKNSLMMNQLLVTL